jgi:hypothetical protein
VPARRPAPVVYMPPAVRTCFSHHSSLRFCLFDHLRLLHFDFMCLVCSISHCCLLWFTAPFFQYVCLGCRPERMDLTACRSMQANFWWIDVLLKTEENLLLSRQHTGNERKPWRVSAALNIGEISLFSSESYFLFDLDVFYWVLISVDTIWIFKNVWIFLNSQMFTDKLRVQF